MCRNFPWRFYKATRTNCVKLTNLGAKARRAANINCHESRVMGAILVRYGVCRLVGQTQRVESSGGEVMNALYTATAPRFNVESSKPGGAIWNSLQELKEMASRELLDDGPICQNQRVERFSEDLNDRELGLRRRSLLERRLMEITNAQDRLMDERYGRCTECQEEINSKRLAADPATSLCLDCQKVADGERRFPTM